MKNIADTVYPVWSNLFNQKTKIQKLKTLFVLITDLIIL